MLRKATPADLSAVSDLAARLWPDHTATEMEAEFLPIFAATDTAIFLVCEGNDVIGFAQCSLRHDYVEGTESSPVGYLEGIYVADSYRCQGYARLLLAACEIWAKEQGCTEFASDCELHNQESLHFHMKLGFEEANRIICFVKKI